MAAAVAVPDLGPAIARKVGEGVDRPDGDKQLPLDIQYSKLAEWLVGRQKLPADWHKRLTAIQAKAADCFKELAPEMLAKLEGGADAPLDYFRAVQIRDLLSASTTERTLFGGLTGQAAVWDKIVKAYEKGGVYMGEAGMTLIQNADYEIPYLRKQAARLSQQVVDAERREAEAVRSAGACATAYKQECARLGISGGVNVRAELRATVGQELPQQLAQVLSAVKAQGIADAAEHYAAFTAYAHARQQQGQSSGKGGASKSEAAAAAAPTAQELLPILYEAREGKTAPPAPETSTSQSQPEQGSTSKAAPAGIDWGLDEPAASGAGGGTAAPGGISWDFDVSPQEDTGGSGQAAGGISWDIDVGAADAEGATAGAGADPQTGAGGISWDIDVSAPADDSSTAAAGGIQWDIDVGAAGEGTTDNQAAAAPAINWDIDVSSSGQEAAAGTQAGGLSSLEEQLRQLGGAGGVGSTSGLAGDPAVLARLERDGEYRGRLLDDLQELRAFLVQRRADISASSSSLLSAVMPEHLQAVDASTLTSWLSAVDAALGVMRSPRMRDLLMLATSQRYLERLALALSRRAGQESRLLSAAAEAGRRRNEARASLAALAPKFSDTVRRTSSIKSHIESALGATLGRRVFLMGEINQVLAATLL